jgi:hypothetical protein
LNLEPLTGNSVDQQRACHSSRKYFESGMGCGFKHEPLSWKHDPLEVKLGDVRDFGDLEL